MGAAMCVRLETKSWVWCVVALICTSAVYFGGAAATAVDWTKVVVAEVNGDSGGDETKNEDTQRPDFEEQEPVEEPENSQSPAPEEKPAQLIDPRPNVPTNDPGVGGRKVIALTFDDGPSPATTPRLLDILRGREAKATFFVLGTMAQRSPDILRREVAEGHEIASHTPYHNQLTKLSFAQVRAEAVEMDRIFTEILGMRPPFTRPPYGSQNATVGQALGQPMVLWSIDPRDWADRNANVVCTRVVNAAKDGAIILVHDIHASTVDAVPCIIDSLRARGYEFLTVSELAKVRGVTMVNGGVYYNF